MRTIRVTGSGMLKLKPDTTKVSITLEGFYLDYSETLRHSSENTETLKDLLSAFGFERSDLKTLNFSVDTEYEGYEEEGIFKQRLKGYRFHHYFKIEFDSDNERLGKILYTLANSELNPEIRISYTVKDHEKAKNDLLGKAVNDAKSKAEIIACAASVSLGDIQNIEYSLGIKDFEVRPMNRALMKMSDSEADNLNTSAYSLDIEPDDIEVSDSVTVIWEIL